MLDAVTLDQLRVLAAIVDAGSFTAAAKRLRRAQSAVSHAVASLEAQLQLALFDRSTRKPTLTPAGAAVLGEARSVLARAERLRARARGIAAGVEGALSLAVSAVVPLPAVTDMLRGLAEAHPTIGLHLDIDEIGGAALLVKGGSCDLGIVGAPSLAAIGPGELEQIGIGSVDVVAVAAPSHPLAGIDGEVTDAALADHRQLVPSSRAGLRYANALVHDTWDVTDLPARYAMIRAGLGWGTVPAWLSRDDLRTGRIKVLALRSRGAEAMRVPLYVIHRATEPPGPAGQWVLRRLRNGVLRQEAGRHD